MCLRMGKMVWLEARCLLLLFAYEAKDPTPALIYGGVVA